MKKYKVVTQRDKWFSGKFDPVELEKLLNELAAGGWRVVSMVSASREGVLTGGGKDELIVLLEMDVSVIRSVPVSKEPSADGVYQL